MIKFDIISTNGYTRVKTQESTIWCPRLDTNNNLRSLFLYCTIIYKFNTFGIEVDWHDCVHFMEHDS